jgi:hypothetical protein
MLRVSDTLRRNLLTQPETGMGYQRVDATLRDNKTERGIVFNAELLMLDGEAQATRRSYPNTNPYSILLKRSSESGVEIRALRVLPREGMAFRGLEAKACEKKAVPAKDGATEKTKADEVFKRFSAFQNDYRVNADGSLSPGSYATTEEDAKNVKTGSDAVARYALPNSDPASYRFTIKPNKDSDIQYGTVEPANGQPGGSVEVIFTTGTQAKTVTGPDKIPDR